MVQLMNTVEVLPELQWRKGKTAVVKLEIEDDLDEAHGPLNKRSKLSSSLQVCFLFVISLFVLFHILSFCVTFICIFTNMYSRFLLFCFPEMFFSLFCASLLFQFSTVFVFVLCLLFRTITERFYSFRFIIQYIKLALA